MWQRAVLRTSEKQAAEIQFWMHWRLFICGGGGEDCEMRLLTLFLKASNARPFPTQCAPGDCVGHMLLSCWRYLNYIVKYRTDLFLLSENDYFLHLQKNISSPFDWKLLQNTQNYLPEAKLDFDFSWLSMRKLSIIWHLADMRKRQIYSRIVPLKKMSARLWNSIMYLTVLWGNETKDVHQWRRRGASAVILYLDYVNSSFSFPRYNVYVSIIELTKCFSKPCFQY